MRLARTPPAMLAIPALAALLAGCNPPALAAVDFVYLRVQNDFSKTACNQRLSFTRLGPDGLPAGPADANGNFVIPQGRSLVLTDLQLTYANPTAAARRQSVEIYIQAPLHGSETPVWLAAATADPGATGYAEHAFTTGILVAAGALVCAAYEHPATANQPNDANVVLLGYLK